MQFASVDAYIAAQPEERHALLESMRRIITDAVPAAQECISYGMPAYKYKGMLAYFASFKNHIGFYPMPAAMTAFKKQLAAYKTTKAGMQFPPDKALPKKLIREMVQYNALENDAKAHLKKGKVKAV
jgi:uncharacterized protein YdhG (YjbR/CyaY superfamily)